MTTDNKTTELIDKVRQMRESASGPEVAAFVAKTVHSGPKAVDKNGVIYSEHPRRVSLIVDAFFASEPSELHSPAVQRGLAQPVHSATPTCLRSTLQQS